MTKVISLLFCCIWLFNACKRSSKTSHKEPAAKENNRTIISTKDHSAQIKAVHDFKRNWNDWEDYSKTLIKDVTGDGKDDTIRLNLKMISPEVYAIIAGIMTHGKLAYADTLGVKAGYDEYFYYFAWEEDSTYYSLLPFSRYYEAYSFGTNWLQDFDNPILPKESYYFQDDYEPVLTYTMNYLENKNIPESELETRARKLLTDVKNSRAIFFENLSFEDPDTWIWNEEFQEFFPINTP